MTDNENHTLRGGALDATEFKIAEMLRGKQRKGILRPTLMNKWEDEFPFVGFRPTIREATGPRKQRDIRIEVVQMYADYGQSSGATHVSKPQEDMLPEATTKLDFRCRRPSEYERTGTNETPTSVFQISRLIYGLLGHKKETLHWNLAKIAHPKKAMNLSSEESKTIERARYIAAREYASALICRSIMLSNNKVVRALPIKLNQAYIRYANESVDTEKPTGNWPEHFAASIEFADGSCTLLPLAIHLLTSRPTPFEEAEVGMHAATKNMPLPGKCAFPWDRYTRPELQVKFENMPMMNICDATFLIAPLTRAATSDVDRETFYPRVYSTAWLWKSNLKKDDDVLPSWYGMSVEQWRDAGKVWQGCTRIATAGSIGDAAANDGSRVVWKSNRKPTQPFAVVPLEDFTCVPKETPAILDVEEYVDGFKTCRAYYECIKPESHSSGLCEMHRTRLASIIATGKPLVAEDLPDVQSPEDVKWNVNLNSSNSSVVLHRLRSLHGSYKLNNVWAADFEGFCAVKKGFSPIPLAIGIVNAGNGSKITGPIRYNFNTIDEMADAIMASGILPPFVTRSRVRETLRRHYRGHKVVGLTISEWKKRLEAIGFNEKTDLLVTWGFTNLDRLGMGRIMAAESGIKATTDQTALKADHLDLMAVFRYHSDIQHYHLWFIYRTYVKANHNFQWHDALFDARATLDLYFVAKRYTTDANTKFQHLIHSA